MVFEADAQPGGQLAEIPHSIRNVAGGALRRTGRRCAERWRQSAALLGARLRGRARRHPGRRRRSDASRSNGERVHARALVLATGTSRQQLPAAPDGAFGGDVTYQVESAANRTSSPVVTSSSSAAVTAPPSTPSSWLERIDGEARASFEHAHRARRHHRPDPPRTAHRGPRRLGARVAARRRAPRSGRPAGTPTAGSGGSRPEVWS